MEATTGSCWFNTDCWRVRSLIAHLKGRDRVTHADFAWADTLKHVNGDVHDLGSIIFHIINDHQGVVANHNGVVVDPEVMNGTKAIPLPKGA
ncbi:MAG: hypothetical protein WAX38_02890 [Minisyncoccia bacterium]